MKKSLIVTLALVFVLGIAGTAFANPYSDVPAGHWAYKAVNDLTKAGVVEGYQGKYHGNDNMTRYEMAAITARAMAKADKADAATKATIDKLAVEFSKELNDLGIRVAKLEKKQGNIKMVGETLLGYTWLDSKTNGTSDFSWRQRFHLSADVTDKISYTARIQAGENFGTIGDKTNAKVTRNFITVKDFLGIDKMDLGRQPIAVGRFLAFADTDNNDGIKIQHKFGKVVFDAYHAAEAANNEVTGANLNFVFDKNSELNAGYFTADPTANVATKADYWNVGFSHHFGGGISLVGDYVKSDATNDPQAYAAQLVYNWKSKKVQKGFYGWEKLVVPSIAHDQGIAFSYFNAEAGSLPGYGNGDFKAFGAMTGATDDVKGYMVSYQNAVAKNVLLSLNYYDAERKDGSVDDKKAVATFEFFY